MTLRYLDTISPLYRVKWTYIDFKEAICDALHKGHVSVCLIHTVFLSLLLRSHVQISGRRSTSSSCYLSLLSRFHGVPFQDYSKTCEHQRQTLTAVVALSVFPVKSLCERVMVVNFTVFCSQNRFSKHLNAT